MALTNLLTTQSRPVLERFAKIMINIIESLNDITNKWEDGQIIDSLVLSDGQSPSQFDEGNDRTRFFITDHDQRKKQLTLSDPVHTVILRDYLQSQVSVISCMLSCINYMFIPVLAL